MDIELKCEDYLQNLTPIAQKMAEDVVRVKDERKDVWSNLSHKEKCQLLDKSLIDFKLAEQYKNGQQNENTCNRGSLSQFSWFSRSQLDLFKHIDVKPKYVVSPQKYEAKEKPKTLKKSEDEKSRHKSHVSKPKNPPPPPPSKRTQPTNPSYEDVSPADNLPKTGFDFLDNW